MPIIKQNFIHSNLTTATYTNWKVQKNYTVAVVERYIEKEATTYFYNDLIGLLSQTGLMQSYDATNFKFKIFDKEMYCVCDSFSTVGITGHRIAAPRVCMDGDYDIHRCLVHSGRWGSSSLTNTTYNSNPWFKFNIYTDNLLRTEIVYTMRIYYNNNYLLVQYEASDGTLCPLMFIIKGALANSTSNLIYMGGCPNTIYDNSADNWCAVLGNTYTVQTDVSVDHNYICTEHYMFIDGKPLFCNYYEGKYPVYNYSGKDIYWCDDREDRLMKSLQDFQNKDEYYVKDATCYNGQITFDNFLIGDKRMQFDSFYKIGDDTYYCAGNYLTEVSNNLRVQTSWPLFLVKI